CINPLKISSMHSMQIYSSNSSRRRRGHQLLPNKVGYKQGCNSKNKPPDCTRRWASGHSVFFSMCVFPKSAQFFSSWRNKLKDAKQIKSRRMDAPREFRPPARPSPPQFPSFGVQRPDAQSAQDQFRLQGIPGQEILQTPQIPIPAWGGEPVDSKFWE